MTEGKQRRNEFSDVWSQNEQHDAKESVTGKEGAEKQKLGNNYWERVADDAASGYKSEDDANNVLNIDQEPDDNALIRKSDEE